jgi:hypothetical protein
MVGSTPTRFRHKFFFPKYLRPHEGTQGNIRKRCLTSQWATEAERPYCSPPVDALVLPSYKCSSSCECPHAGAVPASARRKDRTAPIVTVEASRKVLDGTDVRAYRRFPEVSMQGVPPASFLVTGRRDTCCNPQFISTVEQHGRRSTTDILLTA